MTRNRREFLSGCAALAGSALAGCLSGPRGAEPAAANAPRAPAKTLPTFEVRGSPRELGRAAGRHLGAEIRGMLEARAGWFKGLKQFVASQPGTLLQTFADAARKHTPAAFAELEGWAEGSGVPFSEMLILNLKAELTAMRDRRAERSEEQPGCSTIVLVQSGRLLVAHNEDGHEANQGRMALLRMFPDGQPPVLCASYPGILPGNAPWVNDRGITMTTNFIYTKGVRPGVGRYFLDRQAMEATSLEHAVRICTHSGRAYAFHHVLGSRAERKVTSLEVTVDRQSRQDVDGLYVHTNHLLHPRLKGVEQDRAYVSSSSESRLKVLRRWQAGISDPGRLDSADLVSALASHQLRPYSPCRHPRGKVRGATLLTAVFDLVPGRLRIYNGQPCAAGHHDYPFPEREG